LGALYLSIFSMAKTFFQDGKWIDNPNEPDVVMCSCGGKYIKTRADQEVCLRCLSEEKQSVS